MTIGTALVVCTLLVLMYLSPALRGIVGKVLIVFSVVIGILILGFAFHQDHVPPNASYQTTGARP
jgi:hypothetical protein